MWPKKKYNVLVLGSNGMLGHELYEYLIRHSIYEGSCIGKVVGIDKSNEFDILNTSNNALMDFFFYSIHFDYCINCIAYTDTNKAENTDEGNALSYLLNAIAPKYIAEACKTFNTKLIHISTDYVFSEFTDKFRCIENIKNAEYYSPFPKNRYGLHKLIGEMNIESVFSKKPKDYAIARTSWLYGMHNNKSFIHKFMSNVVKTIKTAKISDAEQKIYVDMVENEISIPTSCKYVIDSIMNIINDNEHGIIHAIPHSSTDVNRYMFAQEILSYYKDSTVDGVSLANVCLNAVQRETYQPKFSTIVDTIHKDIQDWKTTLCYFMRFNKDAILNWAIQEANKDLIVN